MNIRNNLYFRKFRNWLSNLMYGDKHMFMSDAYAESITKKLEEAAASVKNDITTDILPGDPRLANQVTSTLSQGVGVTAYVMRKHGLENFSMTYTDGSLGGRSVRAEISFFDDNNNA